MIEKGNNEIINFLIRSNICEILAIILNYEKIELLNHKLFAVLRALLSYGESQINISNFVQEEFEELGIFEALQNMSLNQNIAIAINAESIVDEFWNFEKDLV